MKRFLTAAAITLLAATSAQAASEGPTTLYNGTYWQTIYYPSNSGGSPMCVTSGRWNFGNGATGLAMLKWSPGRDLFLHISKSTWRFRDGITVSVAITMDPGTREGDGETGKVVNGNDYIQVNIQNAAAQKFVEDFASTNSMVITFRSGNEPPWRAEMAGSAEAARAFLKCIAYLNNGSGLAGSSNTSPVGPQATSPVGPQATSPAPTAPSKPVQIKPPGDNDI